MTFEVVFFFLAGAGALVSAVMMITRPNPLKGVLFLIVNFFCLALLYLLLQAQFIAIIQILVYAGAIMVLFLFVIMLVKSEFVKGKKSFLASWPVVAAFAVTLCGFLMSALVSSSFSGRRGEYTVDAVRQAGNSQLIGKVLFTDYLFPFEVASIILLVAMVGAIVLAKKKAD